jgi:hypothetical protein
MTTSGAPMPGTPRKRSNEQLAAVFEHGDAAAGVERGDATLGDELDASLGKRGEQRLRRVR